MVSKIKLRDGHKVFIIDSDTTVEELAYLPPTVTIAQCDPSQAIDPDVLASLPEQIKQIENFRGDSRSLPRDFRHAQFGFGKAAYSKTKEFIVFNSDELLELPTFMPMAPIKANVGSVLRRGVIFNPQARKNLEPLLSSLKRTQPENGHSTEEEKPAKRMKK